MGKGDKICSMLEMKVPEDAFEPELAPSERPVLEQRVPVEVNIMDRHWKLREERDKASSDSSNYSPLRKLLAHLMADLSYAFGKYRGGGFVGPPYSIYQIYNDFLEILPTQSPSEGFESSCSDGTDIKLDSSLQLISKRMKEILKGIEGRARMSAVRFLGWFLGKVWKLLFRRILVDVDGVERIRMEVEAAAKARKSVMLLPTHRSHIDYLLMSYICFGFNLPLPHIASGNNLNIPIIGTLFAYSGAFFLRRSFRGDNLYKKVLYGYLLRKLREGSMIECFVEGGRSRTGMISDPKVGIILTAVRFVRDGSLEDVVLLPASIDYERTMETNSHVAQLLGKKKKSESLLGALTSGLRVLFGTKCHGSVHVNFADGISVRHIIAEVERPLRRHGSSRTDVYLPEEVYVNAVAQAVVTKQREVSFVTPSALTAASLLGTTAESDFSSTALARLFEKFLELAVRAGANTIPLQDVLSGDLSSQRLVEESFEVLRPILEIPGGKSKVQKEERLSDEYIEGAARQRLRLRYQCGQLVPILAPHAVVATALYSSTLGGERDKTAKPDLVLKYAGLVSEAVKHSIPGAQLDASSLRNALQTLIACDLAFLDKAGCVGTADDSSAHKFLRALRILIAPSINASSACLAAVASLCHSPQLSQEDLTKRARDVVYASIRKESTDWAVQLGSAKEMELKSPVGFPESLSILEIRSAVKNLVSIGIFSSITGSGAASFIPSTHSPNSSLSTPSSHMSLTSVASSRTFNSSNASDVDMSEKKSLGSASETQSAAAGQDTFSSSHLEIAPAYLHGEGIKLLEKLSSLQRFLYRDAAPSFRVPLQITTHSSSASSSVSLPSLGTVILCSGLLGLVLRSLKKT